MYAIIGERNSWWYTTTTTTTTTTTVSYTHLPSPRDRQKSRMPSSA